MASLNALSVLLVVCSLFFKDIYAVVLSVSVNPCYDLDTSDAFLNGKPGNFYCNFEGVAISSGNFIRVKNGVETVLVSFTSSNSDPKVDLIGRVTPSVDANGLTVEYMYFDENDDGNVLKCKVTTTGFQDLEHSLPEMDIFPAPAYVEAVVISQFDPDKTNVITEDVTVQASTSTFTIGGNSYPAGEISASKDGVAVSCT